MEKVTIVLAGNQRQFDKWASESGINPRQTKYYKYVCRPGQAEGLEVRDIIKIGTWYEQPKAYELEELCKSRVR